MSDQLSQFFDFGPFRLDTGQHLLLRDGTAVPLTPKAFETLLVLVRNRGRIVEKDELLRIVWPDTFVEEATLAQNIFTLRKVLSEGAGRVDQYIRTIPKRGYRFVAAVSEVPDERDIQPEPRGIPPRGTTVSKSVIADKPIDSIAVLPMLNASGDPNADYLSDGITESVVNILSLLPGLQVKACSTVVRYKGRDVDPQEAGRELGVDAVLVGSLLPFGEGIIIRMELVNVTNGWQLWGEQYNEGLSNLLKVQEKIAKDISEKLCLKRTDLELKRLFRAHTENVEAYQLYLKGRYFLNMRTEEGYRKAIAAFEQAIEIDPGYPLAYSGLADSYLLFDFYGLAPPWQTIPKARAAAFKALDMDDQVAEAHNSLASIKLIYDRDPEGAQREFKQAINLNPKYAHAHNGYAHCLMEMGQIEGSLAECNLALSLEPLDLEINQHLGWHYLFARQYDAAIDQLLKTLEMGPNFYRARLLLGIAYGQKGAFPEAIAEFHRASELQDTPVLSGFLGYAYAMAGRNKEALRLLSDLLEKSKRTYVPSYSLALIYIGLGQRDEALEWLGKACVEHSHWRGWLQLTPELDSLRLDPQFAELVQRAAFKED
jgi:DNA-binding winged helix-turn-helix (wHTH) protein/tetratricopeptide (TPR) repeat protein